MNFYKSESDFYPVLLDTESCPSGVYIRRNVVTETRENEDSSQQTVYKYDEAFLTNNEYAVYLAQENAASIDYIAMMQGVEL